jgi:hypothetical protein
MRMPSFQFYPADWLNDISLRAVSLEAKGFLIDLMCLMHQSEKYGYINLELEAKLPRIMGLNPRTFKRIMVELEANGRVLRTKEGELYVKKMVEDEKQRQNWRSRKQAQRQRDNQRDVTPPVTDESRSSSSSSSSNKKEIKKENDYAEDPTYKRLVATCKELGLENDVNPVLFQGSIEEYRHKVPVIPALKDCLYWCKDNDVKKINVMRIRNWLRKTYEFQKTAELKKATAAKDAPGGHVKIHDYKKITNG